MTPSIKEIAITANEKIKNRFKEMKKFEENWKTIKDKIKNFLKK